LTKILLKRQIWTRSY